MEGRNYEDIEKRESTDNPKDPKTGEWMNAVMEDIHDGVYETDVHGNFTYFNKALCRILGFPEEVKRH